MDTHHSKNQAKAPSNESAHVRATPDGKSPLFVDDGGAGSSPPVVFVHASAGSTAHWAPQLAHVRRSRRALAVDLPGHGRTPAPADGDWSIPAQAKQLGVTLDSLGLDRVVLVGASIGGSVCLAYAGEHPQRVAGLLLLDPAADGRAIPPDQAAGLVKALHSDGYKQATAQYWATLIDGSKPAVRERLLADLWATPRETITGGLEALLAFNPIPPLRRYHGPRLSVFSKLGETPYALHALVPDLPHQRIEGTGHFIAIDAPDETNHIIDRFLTQVR